MIRDITIGQYYNAESIIHRLDPRTKLVITFMYLISLFWIGNIYGFAVATLALVVYIALSRVLLGFIFKGLRPLAFIIVISMLLNLFTTPGEPLVSLWVLKISKEGIYNAIYVGIRIVYLVIGSSIMTYTTTPTKLTDGIEKMFGWLNKIKIPVHDIAMMMGIALRFIPILTDELNRIMDAQKARGAHFDSNNLVKKAKSMVPILVPLFVSAIRRANDLSMAMEARCYRGGEGRTKMKPLKYTSVDMVVYIVLFVYIVSSIGTIFIGL